MSGNIISEFFTRLNDFFTPLAPAGVNGIEFIAVFLIVYALMFILLERTKLFGVNRGARLLIALAGAYFTASTAFSALLISKLFPHIGLVTLILFGFLIVYSMFGTSPSVWLRNLMIIIGIGIVVWGAWAATGNQINIQGLNMPQLGITDWYTIIFLIIFLVVLIVVGFGFGGKGKPKNIFKSLKDFLEDLTGGQ